MTRESLEEWFNLGELSLQEQGLVDEGGMTPIGHWLLDRPKRPLWVHTLQEYEEDPSSIREVHNEALSPLRAIEYFQHYHNFADEHPLIELLTWIVTDPDSLRAYGRGQFSVRFVRHKRAIISSLTHKHLENILIAHHHPICQSLQLGGHLLHPTFESFMEGEPRVFMGKTTHWAYFRVEPIFPKA